MFHPQYITAASTPENRPFGFVFENCKITGEADVRTFLGRPWRNYASTIFLNTEMSVVVRPEGWNNWGRKDAESTARYAEFNNTGPGEDPKSRVQWINQLTKSEAECLSMKNVLGGNDEWNPLAVRTPAGR
jgi:pectinesterase